MQEAQTTRFNLRESLPLASIILVALLFAGAQQWRLGHSDIMSAMNDFMGALLVLLGFSKLLTWKGFVEAFKAYDSLAARSTLYAYAYPLIEITLGILYLARSFPLGVNAITAVLSAITGVSVARALKEKRDISCACLGTTFKTPLTRLTLIENVLMVIMALAMLIRHSLKL